MSREDCPYCGELESVKQKVIPLEGTIHKRLIKFMGPGRKCSACKKAWSTRQDMRDHFNIMADQLREDLGFLRLDYVEKVRKTNKLSRQDFYKIIDIPRSRYMKMLAGRIQSKKSDECIRAGLLTLPILGEST